ncbi:TPA: S9 family peptidase [Legionella pneumophila]|nr:S9 family peptidase [Legionella pneumophila]
MKNYNFYTQVILLFISLSFCEEIVFAQRSPILNDFLRIKTISEPDLSKNGDWVVYSVEEGKSKTQGIKNIWLVSYDGTIAKQLTHSKKNSNYLPKWSPDGQWIAFLSESGDDKTPILKLFSKQSGKVIRLTNPHYEVSDFVWAPDSKNIVFIASTAKDESQSENEPLVITRYVFKKDEEGYLGSDRSHLYRISIQKKKVELLTSGPYDEWAPAWSPNGKYIAFVTKRGKDPDRNFNSDIYLISPASGSKAIQLTHFPGTDLDQEWDSVPSWSSDNSQIAYIRSANSQAMYYDYAPTQLAVVDVATGQERVVGPVDQWFTDPQWSEDGKIIYVLMETSRNIHLSAVDVHTGKVQRLTQGSRVDEYFSVAPQKIVLVSSDDQHPSELFALEKNGLRQLTHHNQKLLEEVHFVPVEDIEFDSFDGTRIEGLLVKPANYKPGNRYLGILNLHGGPVDQFTHEFNFEWQWLAAQGYVVIAPNPRGSSGRGFNFAKAIYADWGNLDVKDVLAGVDYVIKQGIVDPNKLVVAGWSYGAMLTDYVIASTSRFKAAISGAGTGNIWGNYGVDQYTLQYELELGKPWSNPQVYMKLSYPLMKANRIKTPTLFMCARMDFNVPCIGSEQLYQALRSQNIPTELIIYPQQSHSLDRYDFEMDRLQRIKDWIGFYVK